MSQSENGPMTSHAHPPSPDTPEWTEEEIAALRVDFEAFIRRRDVSPEVFAAALSDLTFDRFSAVNRERCESPSGFNHALASWSTSDWFLAVVGELGEAANIAKKLNRVRDGIPGNKETADELRVKLRRELGDAFVYLDLLAQSLGISIGAAAVEVFNGKSDELGCPIRIEAERLRAALAHGEAHAAAGSEKDNNK